MIKDENSRKGKKQYSPKKQISSQNENLLCFWWVLFITIHYYFLINLKLPHIFDGQFV